MKKLSILFLLSVMACGVNNLVVGNIPAGREKNPDTVSQYVVSKFLFLSGDTRSYEEFSKDKCVEIGKRDFRAYALGYTSSSSVMGLPLSKKRQVKVWCK